MISTIKSCDNCTIDKNTHSYFTKCTSCSRWRKENDEWVHTLKYWEGNIDDKHELKKKTYLGFDIK